MTESPIRCVVIDDNEKVLSKLKTLLEQSTSYDLGATRINREVEVTDVHIECASVRGSGTLTPQSLQALEAAFGMPDAIEFVFTDFAFVYNSTMNESFKQNTRTSFQFSACQAFATQLPDILSTSYPQGITAFAGTVFVYTNSPPPFKGLFEADELQTRKTEFGRLFPNAAGIHFFNIYDNFKLNEGVIKSMSDDEREVLTATVLGSWLQAKLNEITYRTLVRDRHQRRKLFSRRGVAAIITLGTLLGAMTALFGEILFHQLHLIRASSADSVWGETLFGVLLLFIGCGILALLSFLALRILERLADGLFKKTEY